MTTNQEIGERVHLLLRRQSTPQEKLAEHLHISQAAISKKVRGNRPFSVDELLATIRRENVFVGGCLSRQ